MKAIYLLAPFALFGLWGFTKTSKGGMMGYRRVLQFRSVVKKYIDQYDSSLPLSIGLGIIAQESMGDIPPRTGSSGEEGVMQITPVGLAYTGLPYSMKQLASDQDKNIQVGIKHLALDHAYLNDINYAIMAYNISRKHIKNTLEGHPTSENTRILNSHGKNYLKNIVKHSKFLIPMLLDITIDDPNSNNFIRTLNKSELKT